MNRRAATLCTAALLIAASAAAKVLPIYIEDNHAGTFYWLAQNVDLDQPCTLILFDAHSDASGIFDSDKIRDALRNVASPENRNALLDRWRGQGVVQCFNWIESLMPAPIAKVIWVPAEKLSTSDIRKRSQEATALLDGHLEAAPRRLGSLRQTYVVSDFNNLEKQLNPNEPLIVTIDLDYFAGLSASEQETAFARIWDHVCHFASVFKKRGRSEPAAQTGVDCRALIADYANRLRAVPNRCQRSLKPREEIDGERRESAGTRSDAGAAGRSRANFV